MSNKRLLEFHELREKAFVLESGVRGVQIPAMVVLFVVVAKASTFPSCLQFICLVSWRANDLRSTLNAFYLPWLFSFFLCLQT